MYKEIQRLTGEYGSICTRRFLTLVSRFEARYEVRNDKGIGEIGKCIQLDFSKWVGILGDDKRTEVRTTGDGVSRLAF